MIKKKRAFFVVLMMALMFSINAYGYSGVLDTFQGYNFTDVGKLAVDDFNLPDTDLYVEIRIDDSAQRWAGGTYAGMYVSVNKKNWLGNWKPVQRKSFTKQPNDTSYSYLSFTGLTAGDTRMGFSSMYPDQVDFTGTVYDSN